MAQGGFAQKKRLRAYGPRVDLALVDAVLAAPLDDAPRLALAARLEQQGDPMGPALRRDLLDRNRLSLRTKSAFLKRLQEWVGEVAEIAHNPWKKEDSIRLQRGFVEEVFFDDLAVVQHLEALRATWPVRTLTVCGRGRLSVRIEEFPFEHMAGLDFLNISGMVIDARGAAWLAARPELATIRMVWLTPNQLDEEGIEVLYASPWLAQCKSVTLNEHNLLYEVIEDFTWFGALPSELRLTPLASRLLATYGTRPWFPPSGG